MKILFLLLALPLLIGHVCNAAPAFPQVEPTIDTSATVATGAPAMSAPDGSVGTCFDSTKFHVARPDTLFPGRYRGAGSTDRLVKLTTEDRIAYLQRYSASYDDSELFFFSIFLCAGERRQITLLCTHHDDNDVLWLSYDMESRLNGIDTLLTSWGDGQFSTDEYAYWEPWGSLTIVSTTNETARDGNDTMAYLMDTLMYDWRYGNGPLYIPEEDADPLYQYTVERVPQDLTRHWLIKFPTEEPAKEQRYSLRAVMPPNTEAFLTAIGDLNGDKETDYVFALEPDTGVGVSEGTRDLQIVFGTPGGFKEKLFLPGFFPGRSAGGFHDPLGEEGYSGISISGDTLIVGLFGGSAWKWQTRHYYRYSTEHQAFFLVKEQARTFHAASVDTMDEELAELEQMNNSGKRLNAEQQEWLTRLRKMVADYEWHPVVHPMGEYPIGAQ